MKKQTVVVLATGIVALGISLAIWAKVHREYKQAERDAAQAHSLRIMMESAAKTPKTSANYGLAQLCLAVGKIAMNGGVM